MQAEPPLSDRPKRIRFDRILLALSRGFRWRWVWGLLLVAGLIGLITLLGFGARRDASNLQPVVVSEQLVREHPTISCGIHVDQIYELNLNSRTFTADGQFWLVWPAAVQDLMTAHATTPLDLVRMLNRIETWDSTFEVATPAPVALSGGRQYQLYTFSSRFYDDTISFRRDPFHSLSLPIILQAGQPWMARWRRSHASSSPGASRDAMMKWTSSACARNGMASRRARAASRESFHATRTRRPNDSG